MDWETYDKIRGFAFLNLARALHSRHLEDLTQYLAMRIWENHKKGKLNLKLRYFVLDYLRENGIGPRPHAGMAALENINHHEFDDGPEKNEKWDQEFYKRGEYDQIEDTIDFRNSLLATARLREIAEEGCRYTCRPGKRFHWPHRRLR